MSKRKKLACAESKKKRRRDASRKRLTKSARLQKNSCAPVKRKIEY